MQMVLSSMMECGWQTSAWMISVYYQVQQVHSIKRYQTKQTVIRKKTPNFDTKKTKKKTNIMIKNVNALIQKMDQINKMIKHLLIKNMIQVKIKRLKIKKKIQIMIKILKIKKLKLKKIQKKM
jgi:hypothetical protein